jgi:hypothetical protein
MQMIQTDEHQRFGGKILLLHRPALIRVRISVLFLWAPWARVCNRLDLQNG